MARTAPRLFPLTLAAALLAATVAPAAAQTPAAGQADLDSLKAYMVGHVGEMKTGTANLVAIATWYHDAAAAEQFDYRKLWDAQGPEVAAKLAEARKDWVEEAHGNYEQVEGMVAGIPSLASFDVLIDAGPSGTEDPQNALDTKVTLPDGTVLDKPGNYFHALTEPILWGTEPKWVALAVDANGDGKVEPGEALPDANALLGTVQGLDGATADLQKAVAAWQPTLDDAFTALVVMIPTMSGYFDEWKRSPYVTGGAGDAFVANSRLVDVLGILSGLDLTYQAVEPLIRAESPEQADYLKAELAGMIAFVTDLRDRERAGTRFTPEQADQFGLELQTRADALAGQLTQSAALVGANISES